ncbi:subunit I/II of b(o/a)3-type cytochrome C oxidase [Bacillus coahuilensis m2-6]|uniref:Subunit I/II of b(O/a)3-type cytochrome C oxidase n=1 Tax=Bacillus coahuilensis p1.1.43 TaxID=1150625 RepID=A0A147K8S8_9BACI|nr:cytochrome c oxidase subunit 2A [Bacillus coahuilensis]KUP06525.1 subunit I/II of b(o/a)3-type cytochrome C oxidase [Bacillus coahuilensis p1.1.43]KUP08009.1 subunit I/II of b(o/a)3-type cytochrome C oxidase [Bacillus coahuilensis m2-6]
MENPQTPLSQQEVKVKSEDPQSLKGTLVSVGILGGFIVISWVAVFILFINRF